VIDSDQTGKQLPDPASFYYARSPGAGSTNGLPPGQPAWSGNRLARRSRNLWKPILLGMGCLVGAAWIVQAPQKPILGLLGLLPLAIVVLAMNTWGLRRRTPLLRSKSPIRALGGWGLIGAALLVTEFFALSGLAAFSGLTGASPTGHQASLASPPSASNAAAPPSQSAAQAPAPAPVPPAAAQPPPAAVQPAPVAAKPAPAPASAPAPVAAPAAGPLNAALTFLAPAIILLDPSLAADLGLRAPTALHVSCKQSGGSAHHGSGGSDHLSWTSGASNGAASTWNMLQNQPCNHRGSH